MTIQCSNPTCGTIIPVPDGAQYVLCETCSTYHFVSDYENQSRQQSAQEYGLPESSTPTYSSEGYGMPASPDYETSNDVFQSETPGFIQQPPPVLPAAASVGVLLLADGSQRPLKVGKNVIGRKEGDLIINDTTISRRHCIIEVTAKPEGGGWNYFISDIGRETGTGSMNGVFISNRSVRLENHERIPIYHGIELLLGSVRLMLHVL